MVGRSAKSPVLQGGYQDILVALIFLRRVLHAVACALRRISFREAKRALQLEAITRRLHIDVEYGLIACKLRSNHPGQPFKRSGQIFGGHLLEVDINRHVEQLVFAFFGLLVPMNEQTATEDPGKAYERPAIADRAFVAPAVADHFAIKAEDGIPERKATFV